jgi:hypothetical protein
VRAEAVNRDDLAGHHEEPVAHDHGVDRTRDELAVLVAVDVARRPAQERRQLAMRTPRRIPLERLAGGEHQGDDGRRDKLFHRQRAADREDGDDVHARLAGHQVAEDRPAKADPHDPGRHGPGDRGQVVPTGPGEGQAQRQPGRAEREQRVAEDPEDAGAEGGCHSPSLRGPVGPFAGPRSRAAGPFGTRQVQCVRHSSAGASAGTRKPGG